MLNLLRDWVLDPAAMLFVLTLLLFWTGWQARRRGVRVACLVLLVAGWWVASAPAIVNPLLVRLERPDPAWPECPPGSPVVVLGGGVDSRIERATDYGRMSVATLARVTRGFELAQADPGEAVLLAGGALRLVPEADVLVSWLSQMGIEPERLVAESRSMSTADNARQVRLALLALASMAGQGDETGQIPARQIDVEPELRLVTSALHMPRAMATFRATGLSPCAEPTDYQGLTNVPFTALMPQTSALVKFDKWLHEVVALLVYRVRGQL